MNDSDDRWRSGLLWSVLAIAMLIRGAVLYARFDQLDLDPDAYRILAENLANFGGFGQISDENRLRLTAYRPPGYPYVLAWLVSGRHLPSHGVGLLHLLLGIGTVWLVFLITGRLVGRTAAAIAALLVAADPMLLNLSTLVMTETLATFLVALAWWLIISIEQPAGTTGNAGTSGHTWIRGLAIGVVLAAGYFVRPIFVVWVGLIIVILLLGLRRGDRAVIPVIVGMLCVMIVAVGFWSQRNLRALGKPVWATTHGGYTLLLGNNPPFYSYLKERRFGQRWDAESFHRRWAERRFGDPTRLQFWQAANLTPDVSILRSEVEDDLLAQRAAIATIRREPNIFLYSCLVRAGRLWSPLPHQGVLASGLRWCIGGFYIVFFFLILVGIVGIGRCCLRREWLVTFALAIALTGVHTFYWSNMRMRAIATPMLATLAAAGCCQLLSTGRCKLPVVERV